MRPVGWTVGRELGDQASSGAVCDMSPPPSFHPRAPTPPPPPPPAPQVRERDECVLLDTGVIYFSASATARLSELARTYPLDCCT